MAIIPEAQYPGKITAADAEYPYGKARNITIPGDGTGTPWEAALVNDLFGFQQALLSEAGITPTGDPDKVGESQYLDAFKKLSIPRVTTIASMQVLPAVGGTIVKVFSYKSPSSYFDANGYPIIQPMGGGYFEFVAGSTLDTDGGTVFSGVGGRWLRRSDGPACASMWGASPNSTEAENDTAIQAAVNYVSARSGATKRLLKMPQGQMSFTGFTIPETGVQLTIRGAGKYATSLFRNTPVAGACITCEAEGVSFESMSVQQPTHDLSTIVSKAVLVKRPNGSTADLDVTFWNFRVTRFHYAVETWGRGVTAQNCDMNVCVWGLNLEWPNLIDYTEGSESTQKDATGYRNFRIDNNRFHSNLVGAVQNVGTNATKINGISLNSNMLDIGRTLFRGVFRRGVSDGCVVNQTPTVGLDLWDGSEDYTFSNLLIAGDLNAARVPDNFVKIRGNHKNGRIGAGSVFSNCTGHGIDVRDGIVSGLSFKGITFVDPCSEGGNFCPITFVGDNHQAEIDDITLNTAQSLTGIVRGTSALQNITLGDRITRIGNATPTDVGSSGGIKRATILGVGQEEVFQNFERSPGSIVGRVRWGQAGTNGITLESSGSLNFQTADGSLRPTADAGEDIGSPLYQIGTLYTQNAPVVGSDRRIKNGERVADGAEKRVAAKLVGLGRFYKLNAQGSGVEHYGFIAQDVIEAFASEGLDALKYGFIETYLRDDVEHYSLRYEQLMLFIMTNPA